MAVRRSRRWGAPRRGRGATGPGPARGPLPHRGPTNLRAERVQVCAVLWPCGEVGAGEPRGVTGGPLDQLYPVAIWVGEPGGQEVLRVVGRAGVLSVQAD